MSEPEYPFCEYDIPKRCDNCQRMIRRSSYHYRTYIISESNSNEIIESHVCRRNKKKVLKHGGM